MPARSTNGPECPYLIHDRYELTRLLGRGGMSEVYLGHDRELNRTVAIKLMPTHDEAGHGERLRREARAVAAIDHPNVVSVYDIGVVEVSSPSGESVFVVMEYVDGESLRTKVERDGPLAEGAAAEIGEQVCLALHAAHEASVIHRDVSPGNIMLCRDSTVKVLDFGIARTAGSAFRTATGDVLGTPAYISPEQVQGQPLDERSDLYSLGCCLYLMVAGESPFSGTEALAVAYQHVRASPVPPRELNPGICPELEAVILRALEKSPEERYRSAMAMRSALMSNGVVTDIALSQSSDRTEQMSVPSGGTLALSSGLGEPDHDRPWRHTMADPDIDQEDSGSARRWVGLSLILAALAVLVVVAGFAIFEAFLLP